MMCLSSIFFLPFLQEPYFLGVWGLGKGGDHKHIDGVCIYLKIKWHLQMGLSLNRRHLSRIYPQRSAAQAHLPVN
jgi:hypothetical protein